MVEIRDLGSLVWLEKLLQFARIWKSSAHVFGHWSVLGPRCSSKIWMHGKLERWLQTGTPPGCVPISSKRSCTAGWSQRWPGGSRRERRCPCGCSRLPAGHQQLKNQIHNQMIHLYLWRLGSGWALPAGENRCVSGCVHALAFAPQLPSLQVGLGSHFATNLQTH